MVVHFQGSFVICCSFLLALVHCVRLKAAASCSFDEAANPAPSALLVTSILRFFGSVRRGVGVGGKHRSERFRAHTANA